MASALGTALHERFFTATYDDPLRCLVLRSPQRLADAHGDAQSGEEGDQPGGAQLPSEQGNVAAEERPRRCAGGNPRHTTHAATYAANISLLCRNTLTGSPNS